MPYTPFFFFALHRDFNFSVCHHNDYLPPTHCCFLSCTTHPFVASKALLLTRSRQDTRQASGSLSLKPQLQLNRLVLFHQDMPTLLSFLGSASHRRIMCKSCRLCSVGGQDECEYPQCVPKSINDLNLPIHRHPFDNGILIPDSRRGDVLERLLAVEEREPSTCMLRDARRWSQPMTRDSISTVWGLAVAAAVR